MKLFRILLLISLAAAPSIAQFTQQAKLVGSGSSGPLGATQGDFLALSSDGNTLAVGGYSDNNSQGAVWVFTRVNGTWTQQGGKLSGNNPLGGASRQGFSVALS